MKSLGVTLFISVVVFMSCAKQQMVKAKIFQREQVGKERIMIHYEYVLNNKIYKDSVVIRNVVLKGDVIDLIIDPAKPGRGVPDFTR